MKVRWLLVASLFIAMFAIASVSSVNASPGGTHAGHPSCLNVGAPVSSVNAAPSVVTELKAPLSSGCGGYPGVHGVADYKVRAGGGRSFAVSVQGVPALRGQKLYVFVNTSQMTFNPILVCTLHIGPNGNGSCIIDTRTGAIVPTIVQGDSEVGVFTSSDPFGPGVAFGNF